jgi:hypothetical protein
MANYSKDEIIGELKRRLEKANMDRLMDLKKFSDAKLRQMLEGTDVKKELETLDGKIQSVVPEVQK